ncbi:hypothetical protein MCOR25_004416 [Pyricularia grisea]|uniref:Chitin biosynthesis protein CHS5 n=1 Tax=Pyricularia grisea TaxID=148305 RepID=A0A6P8AXA5_PYRGI|nr:hypothetical protein PgNI_10579 [Pyricularia grisea]KAI6369459.1 hypothetical protein MCOR25_004416 [Pyricularia grisea]TLD06980.1 hypothetical protein PgNI_10579 [Pyricularia grisea]
MLVSLTVGKVDAGVTVLLTPDKRLIEFPSILLPPDIESGSIVDITVSRNTASEAKAEQLFRALQDRIYQSFGAAEPSQPVLRCRNATQTSVVLEWDPIQLATADLISLALYRNGQKAGNIPRPMNMHSTKISGLAVDTEYTFHLVLRTTAGTFSSEKVTVRTHKMTDLSGITITTGILPASMREGLAAAVERIGAKMVDSVRIDTTHFVTTEGRGIQWEKAVEMNIPVVRPEWVEACEKNGRILGVTKFYLDAMQPGPGSSLGAPGGGGVAEERSAPPAAAAAQTPASATSTSAAQKDLPPTPAPAPGQSRGSGENGNEESNAAAAGYQPAQSHQEANESDAAMRDKETGGGHDDDSSSDDYSEDEKAEEKPKPTAQDEEKSQMEDIALRPTALMPSRSLNDDNDSSKGEESKVTSPGDGNSFQDVAL